MSLTSSDEIASFRKKSLHNSIKHIKKISPEKRMHYFLELQQSLMERYWSGLRIRFPEKSNSELKEIALDEAKSRVKHRKFLPKTK